MDSKLYNVKARRSGREKRERGKPKNEENSEILSASVKHEKTFSRPGECSVLEAKATKGEKRKKFLAENERK
jgi:hypothetical protein